MNQQFAEYAVDWLSGYSHHITDLSEHTAEARRTTGSEEELRAIQSLVTSLNELMHLLHKLLQQWQQHLENIGSRRT